MAAQGVFIDITGYRVVRDERGKDFMVFIIKIRLGSFAWTVYRRFTQFRNLGDQLRRHIPDCPPCPPKRLLGGHTPEFLEQRRAELLDWVRQLARDERVCRSPEFHEFLRAQANTPPAGMHDLNLPQIGIVNAGLVSSPSVAVSGGTAGFPLRTSLGPSSVASGGEVEVTNGLDAYGGQSQQANAAGMMQAPASEAYPSHNLHAQAPLHPGFSPSASLGQAGAYPGLHNGAGVTSMEASVGLGLGAHGGGGGAAAAQGRQTQSYGGGLDANSSKKVGLGQFALLKVVGKGSFGKVMQVRKKDNGRIYAMKVLHKANIVRRNQVEHTRTERNVLGRIVHPFVVGLNYAFQTADKLYFVLDYCAGGELFFHLGREGRFTEDRTKFYAAQITEALAFLHAHGIVYRDLKPENVLLDHRGNVRLTDFGLSKENVHDVSSGAHSFCGTPEYLAPEVLNRTGHGRAVDWWSLGALMYEMLTGLPPFYCRDRNMLFEKIRKGVLEFPDYLSDVARDILSRLLTRDPTQRLGCGHTDAAEIKGHAFFAGVPWKELVELKVSSPWVPTVTSSLDTSQFDAEFTSMPLVSPSSLAQGPLDTAQLGAAARFEGFTFVAPHNMSHSVHRAQDTMDASGAVVGGHDAAAAYHVLSQQHAQQQALMTQLQRAQAQAAWQQQQAHQQAQAQAQMGYAYAPTYAGFAAGATHGAGGPAVAPPAHWGAQGGMSVDT